MPRIPARRLQTGGVRVPVRPPAGDRRQARRRLDNGLHGRREGQVRTRPLPLLPSPPAPTGTIKSGPNTRHRCRCCSCGMAIYYIFFYTFRTFSCVCVRSITALFSFRFRYFDFDFIPVFVLPKYLMVSLFLFNCEVTFWLNMFAGRRFHKMIIKKKIGLYK